jgi:hypothetical protein
VFPARYELNSYIVFRKRLVSKRLINILYNHDERSDPKADTSLCLVVSGSNLGQDSDSLN